MRQRERVLRDAVNAKSYTWVLLFTFFFHDYAINATELSFIVEFKRMWHSAYVYDIERTFINLCNAMKIICSSYSANLFHAQNYNKKPFLKKL